MTEPITFDTVQHLAVTVSEPDAHGLCTLTFPDDIVYRWEAYRVRANGLAVPQPPPPTVPCTIGDVEFTLTREQVWALSDWEDYPEVVRVREPIRRAVGDAARRWVDGQEQR